MRFNRTLRCAAALSIIAGSTLFASDASAAGFGSYATPSPHYIANSTSLGYASSETNTAHLNFYANFWAFFMGGYDNVTILSTYPTSLGSAYFFWYVDPVPNSNTGCVAQNNSTNPPTCSRARTIFAESTYPGSPGPEMAQRVCHEIGHAVGFTDYAFGSIGCMGGGTANAGNLAQIEIDVMNYCYAFGAC